MSFAVCSSEGSCTMWRMCAVRRAITLGNWITLKSHSNGQARKQARLAFKRLIRMGKSN